MDVFSFSFRETQHEIAFQFHFPKTKNTSTRMFDKAQKKLEQYKWWECNNRENNRRGKRKLKLNQS